MTTPATVPKVPKRVETMMGTLLVVDFNVSMEPCVAPINDNAIAVAAPSSPYIGAWAVHAEYSMLLMISAIVSVVYDDPGRLFVLLLVLLLLTC